MNRKIIAVIAITLAGIAAAALIPVDQPPVQERALGSISFANSGASEAQASFLEGVLLMHSFEFEDAGSAFRQAQQIDADFALAYWGEAMSYNHPLWRQQDRDAALATLGRYAPTAEARKTKAPSEREQRWTSSTEKARRVNGTSHTWARWLGSPPSTRVISRHRLSTPCRFWEAQTESVTSVRT